jgi:hypothetical protein
LVEGCDGELEVAVEDDPGWLAAVPLFSGRAPEGAEVDELVPAELVPAPEPLVGPTERLCDEKRGSGLPLAAF